MKQNFKGVTLTKTKVKNNILSSWNQTSEEDRKDWYKEARQFCTKLGTETHTCTIAVCGVLAALSPIKTWKENKKITEDFIRDGKCGHFKSLQDKAKRIVEYSHSTAYESNTEKENSSNIISILNGNKIRSFFVNIAFPQEYNEVTIDRHALSVALGYKVKDDDMRGITDNQYNFFVECYKTASNKVGVSPLIMQSATWVWYRKQKK